MKLRLRGPLGSLLLSLLACLTLFGAQAFAASKTWNGGACPATNCEFSNASNWVGGVAPVSGDSLVFDLTGLTTAQEAPDNDLVGASFAGITFQGTSSTDSFDITGNSFTLTGSIVDSTSSGFTFVEPNMIINSAVGITTGAGNPMFISGNISGSGDIAINGEVHLLGDNSTYSGNITVASGSLWAESDTALGTAAGGTTVDSGATLYLEPTTSTTYAEPLNLAGGGDGQQFTNFALGVVAPTGTTLTLSGPITLTGDTQVAPDEDSVLKLTGALSGAHKISVGQGDEGQLIVQSSNNTSQTSNGTYEAPAVTLTYSDSQPSTPVSIGANETVVITGARQDVFVDKNGTLKGTGTLGVVDVGTGGTIAPGMSPGCLTTADLTIGGTLQEEIGGATACTGYDQIKVTGTVDLTGGTLSTTFYNGYTPKAGESYTIIDNDAADAVTGTFSGMPEGSTFTLNGYVLKISYKGGDGNDVVLTVQSVPSTPNTGFQTLGNPMATLLVTGFSAASIAFFGRSYAKASKK